MAGYNLYRYGKFCGIYLVTNMITGEQYIGQSRNIGVRWLQHLGNSLKSSKTERLYEAVRRYGITNFSFQILEECDKKDLNEREKYWICELDTYNTGYNRTLGGS